MRTYLCACICRRRRTPSRKERGNHKNSRGVHKGEAKKVGLQANEEKKKFVEINRIQSFQPYLNVLDCKFFKTDEFKYFGVTITSNNKQD